MRVKKTNHFYGQDSQATNDGGKIGAIIDQKLDRNNPSVIIC